MVKNVVDLNPQLFQEIDLETENGSLNLYHHFQGIVKKYKSILKMNKTPNKAERLQNFLSTPYKPPQRKTLHTPLTPRKRKMQDTINAKNTELKRVRLMLGEAESKLAEKDKELMITEASYEILEGECKEFQEKLTELDNLNEELRELQSKNVNVKHMQETVNRLEAEVTKVSLKLNAATCKLRLNSKGLAKLNEKLERRSGKVTKEKAARKKEKEDLLKQIKEKSRQIDQLKKEKDDFEKALGQETADKQKLKKLLTYHKGKGNRGIRETIKEKEEEIIALKKSVQALERETKELENLLNFTESPIVTTFADGKYVDSIREVYIKLLSMNVGRGKVEEVIKTVLGGLTNVTIDGPLPSAALTSVLSAEARTLANIQAAKALAENPNSTMHYDETTKYGFKSGSVQVTVGDRSYAVGLFDQDMGTSERLFDSIKQCLKETADNLERVTGNAELSNLVLNIKNTMTDRHSTNYCVDQLLETWRKELASKSIKDFSSLPADAQTQIYALNKLRCSLHFLLGLADAAEIGLSQFDKTVRTQPIQSFSRIIKANESGTTRTIRTVCKTFEKHGSEQSGIMAPFAVFLKESPVRLTMFRGNRFNVLFWNGACVYFHRQHFKDFFKVHGTPNRLLEAVKEDISDELNIAGCRALGIVDKLVTGPFWRLCESVPNILDLNPAIREIQANCLAWADDASPMLFNQTPAFAGASVHRDKVFESLFQQTTEEMDLLTIAALELILGNCCVTIVNQMKDVLEGGPLANPSAQLREETKSSPTTNALSERVFASYDRLIRQRPNATTLNIESTILFETNKTSDWLNGLDNDTKKFYMQMARKSAKSVIRAFHQRRNEIKENIMMSLLQKQKDREEKEKRVVERKRAIIQEVQDLHGEWESIEKVERELDLIKDESNKRSALIAQLKYQKLVLGAKARDNKQFQQSSKGQVFDTETLKENLCDIIEFNSTKEQEGQASFATPHVLEENERRQALEKTKAMIRKKLQAAQMKRLANNPENSQRQTTKRQKKQPARFKIKKIKPADLVGKVVEHTFDSEDEPGTALTYTGTVTRIVERKKKDTETLYEIVYEAVYNEETSDDDEDRDEDEKDTFVYELLDDY